MTKQTHRIPDEALVNNMEGRVDEEYMAEVEAMTQRRAVRDARTIAALKRKQMKIQRKFIDAKKLEEQTLYLEQLSRLIVEINDREFELNRLHDQMRSTPQSGPHRGTKSNHGPVGGAKGGLI